MIEGSAVDHLSSVGRVHFALPHSRSNVDRTRWRLRPILICRCFCDTRQLVRPAGQTDPMPVDTKLTKSVGEHWACTVLAGLGWSVALTLDGIARTDLLAVHSETGSMIEVQVKTASPSPRPSWMFGARGTQPARSDAEWFVLVIQGGDPWSAPRTFVVPRDHVAAGVHISYMDWLTDPDARPGSRNTRLSAARTPSWVFEGYEGRWDLLTVPADEVPILLPEHFIDLAATARVGLPAGHPWRKASVSSRPRRCGATSVHGPGDARRAGQEVQRGP